MDQIRPTLPFTGLPNPLGTTKEIEKSQAFLESLGCNMVCIASHDLDTSGVKDVQTGSFSLFHNPLESLPAVKSRGRAEIKI